MGRTAAQERQENKREWAAKLTRNGHKIQWKLVKADRRLGLAAYYHGTCRNCPGQVRADENGVNTVDLGWAGKKRCRGAR